MILIRIIYRIFSSSFKEISPHYLLKLLSVLLHYHNEKQFLNIIFTEENMEILCNNLINMEKIDFSLSELITIALASFQIFEKDFHTLRRIVKNLSNDYISKKTNLTNFLMLYDVLKIQNKEFIANFSEKSIETMENLNDFDIEKFIQIYFFILLINK